MADAPTSDDPRGGRDHYSHWLRIPTRWMDNDVYGHVNNVTYYSFFDTAVNEHLITAGVLDVERSPVFGVVVETGCRFHDSLTFPEVVEAGLRVAHLGTSSVRYEIGLFREGSAAAAATGHFVHVYVDRGSRRPHPIPDEVRALLAASVAGQGAARG